MNFYVYGDVVPGRVSLTGVPYGRLYTYVQHVSVVHDPSMYLRDPSAIMVWYERTTRDL